MLELLEAPPSGDARMPVLHVRRGKLPAFIEQFTTRFGDRMILVPTAEAEHLELFGPGEMSSLARSRFGHFIAVPFRAATLSYYPPTNPQGNQYAALHAGLSPQEMWVPLCVAG